MKRRKQKTIISEKGITRRTFPFPPLGIVLARSKFGTPPLEGYVPLHVFREKNVQIYSGLPSNPLARLLMKSGETTAKNIVHYLFPYHCDQNADPEIRFTPRSDLSPDLKKWIEPVSLLISKIREEGWIPPPVFLLNFSPDGKTPRLCRAETLCGQVPDGNHRVLAYSILAAEKPDLLVPVKIGTVNPFILGISNLLTSAAWCLMRPLSFPRFYKKRFAGSAVFKPID